MKKAPEEEERLGISQTEGQGATAVSEYLTSNQSVAKKKKKKRMTGQKYKKSYAI